MSEGIAVCVWRVDWGVPPAVVCSQKEAMDLSHCWNRDGWTCVQRVKDFGKWLVDPFQGFPVDLIMYWCTKGWHGMNTRNG